MLRLPLSEVPFAMLDVESTGLEPQNGDRLCEIAILHWQGGTQRGVWETLINPQRPMSAGAFGVHNITPDMLARAPTFAAIADTVYEHLKGAVLVAHNAPFDFSFLNTELVRAGRPALNVPLVDTLQLSRTLLVQDRYNLAALARTFGVDRPNHRAMSDVVALKTVFAHLLERLRIVGVTTLDDLLRAQRGLMPGDREPDAPAEILTALREGRRLRISYRTGGGEPIPRLILPLELQHGVLPRLVAYCYLRNSQRTFYLDRIGVIELADEDRAQETAELSIENGELRTGVISDE